VPVAPISAVSVTAVPHVSVVAEVVSVSAVGVAEASACWMLHNMPKQQIVMASNARRIVEPTTGTPLQPRRSRGATRMPMGDDFGQFAVICITARDQDFER
jgi:hypothetical protein